MVIVATATSNIPVTKMVEETRAVGVSEEHLALFSGTARVRYGEQIQPLERSLLRPRLTQTFLEEVKDTKDVKQFEDYKKQHVFNTPLRVRKAKVAESFLKYDKRKVIFLMTHMAGRVKGTIDRATHLLLDEATQTSFTTVVNLACRAPNLKKMMVTGDVRQLGVHLSELQEVLWSGFGLGSITDQLLKSPRMEETVLKRCYRSHGSLVCVSFASYVPHGEHRRIAQEVILILDANLPKSNTIVIVCLYLYEKELASAMKEAREKKMLSRTVEVHTVDSYQAKEADLVIVVKTKTAATADQNPFGSSRISGFFHDSQKATVILSRAREGMFLIADFNTLMGCKVWGRFVEKAKEMVPIFNNEYLRMMESTKIKRVYGILAKLNGNSFDLGNFGRQGTKNITRGACFNCKKSGHWSRECPSK
ncbi:hypothetical protein niasHS_008210 [Heterodera schachtii]|uniref:CCHC-type domain-containing protein n=1 Tax=Heterodera schachtii TaxID=97005 RepID=A0ABD2J405_HETSC